MVHSITRCIDSRVLPNNLLPWTISITKLPTIILKLWGSKKSDPVIGYDNMNKLFKTVVVQNVQFTESERKSLDCIFDK